MATLLFVLLWLSGRIDSPYDTYFCVFLLALEGPAWLRLALYWRAMK